MAASVYIVFFLSGIGISVVLFRRTRERNPDENIERWLIALAPFGVLLSISGIVNRIVAAPYYHWNEPRLAPVFGLRCGYPLFPGPGGVMSGHCYGPVGALIYFPATLSHSPTTAILLGALIAAAISLVPVAWIIFRGSGCSGNRLAGVLLYCLFILFCFFNPALDYSVFNIHADAPALGLGALACCALLAAEQRQKHLYFSLSALLAALSVWSKQNQAPLFVALPLYVLFTQGWRATWVFAMHLFAIGSLVSGLMVLCFGPFENLFYNMFSLLAHHPWRIGSLQDVPSVVLAIWEQSRMPLTICLFFLLFEALSNDRQWRLREFISQNPAALFLIVSLCNLPTTFIGVVKVGGDVNGYSFTVYYLSIAAALALQSGMRSPKSAGFQSGVKIIVLIVSIDCCLFQSASSYMEFKNQRAIYDNPAQIAYDVAKTSPGTVYFPWNPLSGLLVEGKYYHFDYGVYDRSLSGKLLTEDEYRKGIPDRFVYVAFVPVAGLTYASLKYLPQYSIECRLVQLPDWRVFMREERK